MEIARIEATFTSPIDQVWELMTDLNHQDWRSQVERVEVIDKNKFIEYDKSGFQTEFLILNKIKNDVYEFNMMNKNMEGHWIGKLKAIDEKTTSLQMTEAIELKKKTLKFVVKKYLHQQQNLYIQDLKKALGE